jgi:tripartite-type tricarboxylate transporter receptor subunit TctC
MRSDDCILSLHRVKPERHCIATIGVALPAFSGIAMTLDNVVRRSEAALFVAVLAFSVTHARAQDAVADFYRGKTINISVGFTAGGGYDLHARTLARVFGRHVPGSPAIVIKNVPGAAGLVLANSLFSVLPEDGTEIATFDRAIPLEPLLDPDMARFDALKLNWIGSTDNDASTCFSWYTSPVKTLGDLMKHELIVGATGSVGDAVSFPRLLNATVGTKFNVVTGYPGSAQALLAMERGETQGFCSMGFSTLEVARPDWVRDHKVNILLQLALQKNKDHLDVPLALDYAKTPRDRQMLELIVSPNLFARPFAVGPGVPEDRVRALRTAFNEAMTDPEYIADTTARKMHVQLVKGEEIEAVLRRVYAMPKDVVERVRQNIK